MVERVFTTSTSLDSEAIQHFVIKLCEVSKLEVNLGGPQVSQPASRHEATQSACLSVEGPLACLTD